MARPKTDQMKLALMRSNTRLLLTAVMLFQCAAMALIVLYYRHMAYWQFGGVTGDLAGWFSQMCELCLLAAWMIGGKLL